MKPGDMVTPVIQRVSVWQVDNNGVAGACGCLNVKGLALVISVATPHPQLAPGYALIVGDNTVGWAWTELLRVVK